MTSRTRNVGSVSQTIFRALDKMAVGSGLGTRLARPFLPLAPPAFSRNGLAGQTNPQRVRRWQKRADYASGCCSCASLDDGCTLRYIVYSRTTRSSVSSARRRFVRTRYAASRLDFAIANTLPPTLCCALVQCAVASC